MFVDQDTASDIEELKQVPSLDAFVWVEDDDLPQFFWVTIRELSPFSATSFMKVPGGRIYSHAMHRQTIDGWAWEPQGMVFVPEPSE